MILCPMILLAKSWVTKSWSGRLGIDLGTGELGFANGFIRVCISIRVRSAFVRLERNSHTDWNSHTDEDSGGLTPLRSQ